MTFELLVSQDKRSYFINCKQEGEILEAGAVYIAPSSSSPMQLLSEDGAKLTVTIPPEALNQASEMVAVDTSFFIE